MRLHSLLVAILSAVVVADTSWSWFRADNAIDIFEDPYSQSLTGSLSAQSDSFPSPGSVPSTELAKSKAVFKPDCTGFEYTLCCTGVQTPDWNTMDGKFFSITDCEQYKPKMECHVENWYCCHQFLPGVMWIISPQGTQCQDAQQKNNVVKRRQPQPLSSSRWQE